MSTPFNARQGPIIVSVLLSGPNGDAIARLAVDTGATTTLIRAAELRRIGYDPAAAPRQLRVATASGMEQMPLLDLSRIEALGQSRSSFPVLAHALPAAAPIDGLLGLDFFRGTELVINFRTGQIDVR